VLLRCEVQRLHALAVREGDVSARPDELWCFLGASVERCVVQFGAGSLIERGHRHDG